MIFTSTESVLTQVRPFADIRCQGCKRLLLRWEFSGTARIEVKCPRCGEISMVSLSTG